MAFVSSIVSLPVPSASFILPGTTNYNPTPPTLNAILESILPTSQVGTVFAKALKSPSALVQHTAALTFAQCLDKLQRVLASFADVAQALEEDIDGQWTLRAADVVRAARARVPDFQVVVAFVLQYLNADGEKAQLLSEAGLRVMWLYHRALPDIVREARFDVGKLLGVFGGGGEDDKLLPVRQLHVLRILPLSDQFTWSAKLGKFFILLECSDSSYPLTGSTGKTYLHALLTLYIASPSSHSSSRALLTSLLGGSVLFSHDPSEFSLWLSALPTIKRSPGAKGMGSDGEEIELEDEGAAVLAFLDDCISRCLKTPYRYLEDLSSLCEEGTTPTATPSPLLATVLEQLAAKNLGASDALALFTFVRKLAFSLVGKSSVLCARNVSAKARQCLAKVDKRVRGACGREVDLLRSALDVLENSKLDAEIDDDDHPVIQSFFDSLELQPGRTCPACIDFVMY